LLPAVSSLLSAGYGANALHFDETLTKVGDFTFPVDSLGSNNPGHAELTIFLVNTGARVGEASKLTCTDVYNYRATRWPKPTLPGRIFV
jgi:hypothetical protein